MITPAPIIVTALIGEPDFTWLDDLRRTHFPPERNHLRAHVTLFHHLPPSVAAEIQALLQSLTAAAAPPARIAGVINLGRGVAFRIESAALADMRAMIADHFAGMLTPQDQSAWRPHVTVQNKVAPADARVVLEQLKAGFAPRPLAITGLAAWWYRGGPWEPLAAYAFGSGRRITPPS